MPDTRTAEERRRDWTFWSAHDFLTERDGLFEERLQRVLRAFAGQPQRADRGRQRTMRAAGDSQNARHSAEASAPGFHYQAFFALLTLPARDTDNAAIGEELLDDIDSGLAISETFGLPSPPILSAPSGR
ncbi:hypothetical protein [Sorangium sp. So ce145]|uniref:hypothetical protein n=1 Tax=Sorangium sp. So ce145 TaxID=3133285 RepID=UPI003F5DEE07